MTHAAPFHPMQGRRHTARWWTGLLFAIGSACFALGALPGYLALVGAVADGVTFFVGSVFFTTAAFLQYRDTSRSHRADWWAAVVQLAGTVAFNATTFRALTISLADTSYDRLVWTPDIVGCACFLVASELAFASAGHELWSWIPHDRGWRIAAVNLAGSLAFAASGVASFVVPGTDAVRNITLVNIGTFVGALCFLAGAGELMREARQLPAAA